MNNKTDYNRITISKLKMLIKGKNIHIFMLYVYSALITLAFFASTFKLIDTRYTANKECAYVENKNA